MSERQKIEIRNAAAQSSDACLVIALFLFIIGLRLSSRIAIRNRTPFCMLHLPFSVPDKLRCRLGVTQPFGFPFAADNPDAVLPRSRRLIRNYNDYDHAQAFVTRIGVSN